MINFSRTVARPQHDVTPVVTVRTEVPVVHETITIKPAPRRLGGESSDSWEKVRDYVIERVEALHGPFPRDARKETTIFMAFVARWPQAMEIARYAFEEQQGFWKGSPVSVARFHKTSDIYFAEPIAQLLNA